MSFDDAPWLIGITGPVTDLKVKVIGTEITIGRDKGCDICVEDDQVSPMHAGIVQSDDGLMIIDMNSEKGTYVNDILITGPRKLANGDRIKLGSAVFRVHYPTGTRSGTTSVEMKIPQTAAAPPAAGTLLADLLPLLKKRSVQLIVLSLLVATIGIRYLVRENKPAPTLPPMTIEERNKILATDPADLPKVQPDKLLAKLYLEAGKKLANPRPTDKQTAETAYVYLKLAMAYSKGVNDPQLAEMRVEASDLLDWAAEFLGKKPQKPPVYRWDNIESDIDTLPADIHATGRPEQDEPLANEYYERGRTYLMVMFLEPGNGIKAWRNLKCYLALRKGPEDPERIKQVRDWLRYTKEKILERVEELKREVLKKEKLHLWDEVKTHLMEIMALLDCKESTDYKWAQTKLKDLTNLRRTYEREFKRRT